jgi:transcription antitermination protein NusB
MELTMSHDDSRYSSLSQREKRALIFHILYAAEACDYQVPLQTSVDNINRGFDFDMPLDSPEVMTAQEIIEKKDDLDSAYLPFLSNWRLERIGVCTKLILRYAIWEINNTTTDHKIIINEAVELAKCFAEKDAFKFINGILDEVSKQSGKTTES